MSGQYILIGQTPVRCEDLLEWARWMETAERTVKTETVNGLLISTVFLGLDHNHLGRIFGGRPLLFETMTFSVADNPDYQQEQDRCSTWLEAEEMHRRMVAKVINSSPGEPACEV